MARLVMLVVLFIGLMPTTATAEIYRLKVSGLACPFCAYGIEKRLLEVDGVSEVKVVVAEGVAQIITSRPILRDKLNKAVSEAGFTLEQVMQIEAQAPSETTP